MSEPRKRRTRAEREAIVAQRWAEKPGYCTADSKRTKKRCEKRARDGFKVCEGHGAGFEKREREGSRKRAGAPTIHGIRSRRLQSTIAEAAAEYATAGDELFRLDTLAAHGWALMEYADRIAHFALQQFASIEEAAKDPARAGEVVKFRAGVMSMATRAVETITTCMTRLESLALNRHKMQTGDGGIGRLEMIALLRLVSSWVRELAADPSVPRERIADALVDRVQAYVAGQATAPSPA